MHLVLFLIAIVLLDHIRRQNILFTPRQSNPRQTSAGGG
jgi:hypothetical protein